MIPPELGGPLPEALAAVETYERRCHELRRLRDVEGYDFDDARLEQLAGRLPGFYEDELAEVRTCYARRASSPLEKNLGRSDTVTLTSQAIAYATRHNLSFREALQALAGPRAPVRTSYSRSPTPPPPPRPPAVDPEVYRLRARALMYVQAYSCSFDEAMEKVRALGGAK